MPAEKAPKQTKPSDTSPAEAADAEATSPDAPITVTFRGQTFTIARDVVTSAKFIFSLALPGTQATIYEALGPQQAGLFISLVKPGEQWIDVSNEFMTAFNAAAGWGNS